MAFLDIDRFAKKKEEEKQVEAYSFNPFRKLRESKPFPHSRTLRTSFATKLGDTFRVFWGRPRTASLFDWMTLGIPTIAMFILGTISAGSFALMALAPKLLLPLTLPIFLACVIPTIAAGIAVTAVKFAFSLAMTAISSPIVTLAHLFSRIPAFRAKKAAKETVVELTEVTPAANDVNETPDDNVAKQQSTLGALMKAMHCKTKNLVLERVEASANNDGEFYNITTKKAQKAGLAPKARISKANLENSSIRRLNPDNINKRMRSM